MQKRILIASILVLVGFIVLAGGAWYVLRLQRAKVCPFSGRPIHSETRALVTIGGKDYETCCVRCAIVEAQQTGERLRIRRVADFDTGKLLDPSKAWFVESSDVNLCMRSSPATESPGRETTYVRAFDRCSPSALAFSSEQHARDFIARHGGVLKRLADLQKEAASTTGKVKRP